MRQKAPVIDKGRRRRGGGGGRVSQVLPLQKARRAETVFSRGQDCDTKF